MNNEKKLTTAFGAPVPDNRNSATAGKRGPVLMQDVWLMEKLAHFEREVIPERRMHAKEYRCVVTYEVPVSFFRIKFYGKATNVAFCIGRTALTSNGGETHE